MMPKLKYVWANVIDPKFRKGFIKYLKSLDFEEFEVLFNHYTKVLYYLRNKYKNDKPKFLSKRWFKEKILDYKYDELFKMFWYANSNFIEKSNNLMSEKNTKMNNLLKDIMEKKEIINFMASRPLILTPYSTQKDLLYFYISIIDNIYTSEILIKSINELNELQKKK